jgi:DNA-binding MarR family transcriptional regulator/GNAT superfamily N-acetyltransferase
VLVDMVKNLVADDKSTPTDERMAAIRAFNRFYTNVIGVLGEGLLNTPYSLTEARVLFELAHRPSTEVADLRRSLAIDAGYLSRILSRFETDGLTKRTRSESDGRRRVIRLTSRGRRAFRLLNSRSEDQVRGLLEPLSDEEQKRLIGAMDAITRILSDRGAPDVFVLRPPESGDWGWVVQRHGALYAFEYGWNEEFESLVARIVADYVDDHDPKRESAWIAEVDGEPVGCVFCVRKEEKVAQLRLLLVEPSARGLGIGRRLVEECMKFARRAGYERMMLWTNSVLEDARRIYERAGFELVEERKHHSFGHDLVEQYWWTTL